MKPFDPSAPIRGRTPPEILRRIAGAQLVAGDLAPLLQEAGDEIADLFGLFLGLSDQLVHVKGDLARALRNAQPADSPPLL